MQDPKFISYCRPALGYMIGACFSAIMLAIALVIILHPSDAVLIINALPNTLGLWSLAFGVVGLYVHRRSQDKQVSAGQTPTPLIGALRKPAPAAEPKAE